MREVSGAGRERSLAHRRVDGRHLELRQLRYFVTLADELHFGRAAAREHIVQSALSQQIQRLERELGVLLVSRTTHRVELTRAGRDFLHEVRKILEHVDRAAAIARGAGQRPSILRVGILEEGYEAVRDVVRDLLERCPHLEVHQVEAGVPEQIRLLADGRLDVGIGRASLAPPEVASMLFRLDPLGVLLREDWQPASGAVPVAALAHERLLLHPDGRAPEFDQFVNELCRSAGFSPTRYPGTVSSRAAATDLVLRGRCVVFTPASCVPNAVRVVWRPLVAPSARYPWSVLWRADDDAPHVAEFLRTVRRLSQECGWLEPADKAAG